MGRPSGNSRHFTPFNGEAMPRSPTDATRFTATGPHANSKFVSSATASSRQQTSETSREKVARLRNAARQAKLDRVSTFDKVVIRGRVWADRAHRFTTMSLIGLTGVAGLVTVFAVGQMIVHNRKKRNEYYAEQATLHASSVAAARQAAAAGLANEEQRILLDEERQIEEQRRAKADKKGVFTWTKELLFSGLKKSEEADSASGPVSQELQKLQTTSFQPDVETASFQSGTAEAIPVPGQEQHALSKEGLSGQTRGASTKGWFSWLGRR